MRSLIVLAALAAATLIASSEKASAADKAATKELPAALKAIGASESAVVTKAEAHKVRGEGFYIQFDGLIWTNNIHGMLSLRGCANFFSLYADPNRLQIIFR